MKAFRFTAANMAPHLVLGACWGLGACWCLGALLLLAPFSYPFLWSLLKFSFPSLEVELGWRALSISTRFSEIKSQKLFKDRQALFFLLFLDCKHQVLRCVGVVVLMVNVSVDQSNLLGVLLKVKRTSVCAQHFMREKKHWKNANFFLKSLLSGLNNDSLHCIKSLTLVLMLFQH